MITRRRLLLFGPVVGLLALGAGVWLLWPHTAITRENFDKVRVGMNLAEVETVLGGPERDDSTGPLMGDSGNDEQDHMAAAVWRERLFDTSFRRTKNPSRGDKWWISDVLMARVVFDENGQVVARECLPVRRVPESLFERLRRWTGL